jgi:hypothetical protein
MSFPFPKLLAFLEEEKDQVEFMKVAAEVGLDNGDIELAKLLLALQIYKAFFAKIPRQIKTVHGEALQEFHRLAAEVAALADRTASDAATIRQTADEIHSALKAIQPAEVAKLLHKRLVDDTLSAISGSLRVLATATAQIDSATRAMDEAGYQAAVAIDVWQKLSLRRVWASALCFSFIAAFGVLTGVWFLFLRHQSWWLSLQ